MKTADNPGLCWPAPIPVSPHLVSNSVYLVCFHILSLSPFLCSGLMLSFLCSSSFFSSICQPFISLSMYICSALICPCFTAYQLLNVGFVCLSPLFLLPKHCNFSLYKYPVKSHGSHTIKLKLESYDIEGEASFKRG